MSNYNSIRENTSNFKSPKDEIEKKTWLMARTNHVLTAIYIDELLEFQRINYYCTS
jgi:hypothetical protein